MKLKKQLLNLNLSIFNLIDLGKIKLSPSHKVLIALAVVGWFSFSLFSGLRYNQKRPLNDFHRELKADKAGYNVLLPALFIYHFDGRNMPDSIESITGHGFQVNRSNGIISTKYPYGVALLQLPFWHVAHQQAIIRDGYSSVEYYHAIDWAASFYFALGLFLLYLFSCFYYENPRIPFVFSFVVLPLGTNLLYYATADGGMSHIYSFFTISGFLFFYKRHLNKNYLKDFVISILFFSLALAIRPVNIIFIWVLLFLDTNTILTFKNRCQELLGIKKLLVITLTIFLFLLPQLIYNYYVTEAITMSLYNDETFINFFAKKSLEVLFAPKNGIILYVPAFTFVVIGSIIYLKQKSYFGFAASYIIVIYIVFYGSWWSYYLGCGYGHRGLIDFYPLLSLPLMNVFSTIEKRKKTLILAGLVLLLFMLITTTMAKEYDCCFYGSSDWDWSYYGTKLLNVFR